jgi:hypothetical protein
MNCLRSLERWDRRFESHSRNLFSVFVLSFVQVVALRRADHSSKKTYGLCKKDYETEEEARAQQRTVEPLMNEWMLNS